MWWEWVVFVDGVEADRRLMSIELGFLSASRNIFHNLIRDSQVLLRIVLPVLNCPHCPYVPTAWAVCTPGLLCLGLLETHFPNTVSLLSFALGHSLVLRAKNLCYVFLQYHSQVWNLRMPRDNLNVFLLKGRTLRSEWQKDLLSQTFFLRQ